MSQNTTSEVRSTIPNSDTLSCSSRALHSLLFAATTVSGCVVCPNDRLFLNPRAISFESPPSEGRTKANTSSTTSEDASKSASLNTTHTAALHCVQFLQLSLKSILLNGSRQSVRPSFLILSHHGHTARHITTGDSETIHTVSTNLD